MTGQELIDFIVTNNLEEYDFGVYREGLDVDWFGGGMDVLIDHLRHEIVI